jgi:hypothetical protein
MSHSDFKKKYLGSISKDLIKLVAVREAIDPTIVNMQSMSKFSSLPENPPESYVIAPVEEAIEWSSQEKSKSSHNDSSLSSPKTPLHRDDINSIHMETSESDDSHAIGALGDRGDTGQENTPVDPLDVGEPGPNEDESGDAQRKFGDL